MQYSPTDPSALNPRLYLLPYAQWRPYQYESLQWITGNSVDVVSITEQPTGSGKSPQAMALSHASATEDKVVALTESRNLQRQYQATFRDCHVHYGRSNYPCVNPEYTPWQLTAERCPFQPHMNDCPYYGSCPYIVSKHRAIASRRTTLNYAYWLVANRHFAPDWLVYDEAHMLSDITLNYVGTSIGQHTVDRWGLPDIPEIEDASFSLFGSTAEKPEDVAVSWLDNCLEVMGSILVDLRAKFKDNPSKENGNTLSSAENLNSKIYSTMEAIASTSANSHWFIRSDNEAGFYHGHAEPAFICRPLTARYDFKRVLGAPDNTRSLMMSATIGDPETFAAELGLANYNFRAVPNQWPPETRPVHILDVPGMGRGSVEKDASAWDKQADAIAAAILNCPRDWHGLILVTRKTEAKLLAERLARRGLQDRLFVMPGADGSYVPTEQQVQAWEKRKKKHKGSICISFSLWQGYDGTQERILIAAKTPFSFIGDPYERARMQYDGKLFRQRAAWTMEQGLGRTRRGEADDYDTDGKIRGYVAIADGNYVQIRKYFSQSLREALVDNKE